MEKYQEIELPIVLNQEHFSNQTSHKKAPILPFDRGPSKRQSVKTGMPLALTTKWIFLKL